MALRQTLAQSIAALERLASLDPEYAASLQYTAVNPASLNHRNEPVSYPGSSQVSYRENQDRIIRRSRSLPSLSEKAPSFSSYMDPHGQDDEADEPKITIRLILQTALNFLTLAASFLIPAVAVCIIGLAADNINWATGRGSQEGNTVDAAVIQDGWSDNGTFSYDRWDIRMSYMPGYYNTPTFSTLIAVGALCTLIGSIVAALSVIRWTRPVQFGRKTYVSGLHHRGVSLYHSLTVATEIHSVPHPDQLHPRRHHVCLCSRHPNLYA